MLKGMQAKPFLYAIAAVVACRAIDLCFARAAAETRRDYALPALKPATDLWELASLATAANNQVQNTTWRSFIKPINYPTAQGTQKHFCLVYNVKDRPKLELQINQYNYDNDRTRELVIKLNNTEYLRLRDCENKPLELGMVRPLVAQQLLRGCLRELLEAGIITGDMWKDELQYVTTGSKVLPASFRKLNLQAR
jgi:hypothetical protein